SSSMTVDAAVRDNYLGVVAVAEKDYRAVVAADVSHVPVAVADVPHASVVVACAPRAPAVVVDVLHVLVAVAGRGRMLEVVNQRRSADYQVVLLNCWYWVYSFHGFVRFERRRPQGTRPLHRLVRLACTALSQIMLDLCLYKYQLHRDQVAMLH